MRSVTWRIGVVLVAFGLLATAVAVPTALGPDDDPDRGDLATTLGVGSAEALVDQCTADTFIWFTAVAYGDTPESCKETPDKVESADAEQVKIDIYSSAAGVHDQEELTLKAMSNYLEDSHEVGLIVGKNEVIRELQNDSTEIQVESAARNAVEDYYAGRQMTLIRSWNTSLRHSQYLGSVAKNETGVSVHTWTWDFAAYYDVWAEDHGDNKMTDVQGYTNETITLVNGTKVGVKGVTIRHGYRDYSMGVYEAEPVTVTPATGRINAGGDNPLVKGFVVRSSQIPDSSYSNLHYLEFEEYETAWENIQTEQDEVSGEVVSFVNASYDKWEAGAFNETDLVDPYVASREYSPQGDFDAWAMATYTSVGINPPENLSQFGSMEIQDHETGANLNGTLLSDGLPQDDTFETGVRYNASTLSGVQMVVTPNGDHELEGEFTIESMRDAGGNPINATTYESVDYHAANLSEYREVSQELSEIRKDIEKIKQQAAAGGGGVIGDFARWLSNMTGSAMWFLIGILALVFILLLVS